MNIRKIESHSVRPFVLGLKFLGLSLLSLSLFSCAADATLKEKEVVLADRYYLGARQIPRCGTRIQMEEILIVDLEELNYDTEKLTREFGGSFTQVTEKPVAVSGRGARETIEQRVREVAAEKGCNVVLLGPVEMQTEIWGGYCVGPGCAGGKIEVPYQLFRMGFRTD